MKPSVRLRPQDIIDAIEEAEAFLDGADLATFQKSRMMKRATERCLEIVSEASQHVPPDLQLHYPHIPWDEIRAIGNVLRHRYQTVVDHVIWRTATISLGELKQVISAMLQEPPPPDRT